MKYNGVNYAVNPKTGKKWRSKEEFDGFDWTQFDIELNAQSLQIELEKSKNKLIKGLEKRVQQHLANDIYANKTAIIKKLKETISSIQNAISKDELKDIQEYPI
jgi:gas vesicle protein